MPVAINKTQLRSHNLGLMGCAYVRINGHCTSFLHPGRAQLVRTNAATRKGKLATCACLGIGTNGTRPLENVSVEGMKISCGLLSCHVEIGE